MNVLAIHSDVAASTLSPLASRVMEGLLVFALIVLFGSGRL